MKTFLENNMNLQYQIDKRMKKPFRQYTDYVLLTNCKKGDLLKYDEECLEIRKVVDIAYNYDLKMDMYYVEAYELTHQEYREKKIDILLK